MKRDPHLQDLSRDHHHALVLARRATTAAAEGSDEEVAAAWAGMGEAFAAELEPHFVVEETLLLPPLEARGAGGPLEGIELGELVARTRDEHGRLRALVAAVADPRARLAEFGELLSRHVRFEERELFPAAEAALDAPTLQAIADASANLPSAARRGACGVDGQG